MVPNRIHRAIRAIYEGSASDPSGAAGLDALRALVGAEHVVMRLRQTETPARFLTCSALLSYDMTPLHLYWQTTSWGADAETGPLGRAIALSSSDDRRAVQEHPMYREFLRPIGGGLSACCRFADHGGGELVVCRSAETWVDFSPRDLARIALLASHLAVASATARRLHAAEQTRDALATVLDSLPDGVIVVSEGGKLVRANRAAEQLCQGGGTLRLGRGVLGAADSAENDRLRRAIDSALGIDAARDGHAGGGLPAAPVRLTFRRPPPLLPIVARVLPGGALPDATAGLTFPSAVVMVSDPGARPLPGPEEIRARLPLTLREAQLAAALARDMSLSEAADSLGITIGTARQYLKAIFARTGTDSQARLVRLLRL